MMSGRWPRPIAPSLVLLPPVLEQFPQIDGRERQAGGGAFAKREVDVLIGTQIVAKGHHFPHLTLVGVIDADLGGADGDIRARERTFQLLHQVSGRAGRAEKPGLVLLQTRNPDDAVMQALASGDRDGFYAQEIDFRERAGARFRQDFPPECVPIRAGKIVLPVKSYVSSIEEESAAP